MEIKSGEPVTIMVKGDQSEVQVLPDGATFQSFGHEGNPSCPILRLADGRLTYGCRCWWGAKRAFADFLVRTFPFAKVAVVEPPEGFADPAPEPGDASYITDVVPKGQYLQ